MKSTVVYLLLVLAISGQSSFLAGESLNSSLQSNDLSAPGRDRRNLFDVSSFGQSRIGGLMSDIFNRRNAPRTRLKSSSGISLVNINNRQIGGLWTNINIKGRQRGQNLLTLNLERWQGNARIGGRLGKMFGRKSGNGQRGRGRANDFSLANRGNFDPELRLGGMLGNALHNGRLGKNRRLNRPIVYIKSKKNRKKDEDDDEDDERRRR